VNLLVHAMRHPERSEAQSRDPAPSLATSKKLTPQALQITVFVALLLLLSPAPAALQKDPGPIPPLKPAKGKIALDIPENTILRSALGLAVLLLVAGRIVQMRRPKIVPPALPAIVQARLALEAAATDDLEASSHVVRRYLLDTFPIGDEGSTAEELSERLAQQPLGSVHAAQDVREFLVGAEHARFAPGFAQEFSAGCTSRARALIEEIEAARTPPPEAAPVASTAYVAAVPPPLPAPPTPPSLTREQEPPAVPPPLPPP
jgi:hypothetical protein